jgi:hypothetical protein
MTAETFFLILPLGYASDFRLGYASDFRLATLQNDKVEQIEPIS